MDTSYLNLTNDGLFDLLSDSIPFTLSSTPLDVMKVSMEFIGRPDKISLAYYQSDEYWWAILRANDIGYGFRASYTMRRDKYHDLSYQMISGIYKGRMLIIPTISDVQSHINKIKGI